MIINENRLILSAGKFRGIKQGSRIEVDISRRLDARNAVLEYKGERIKAEFVRGVPDTGRIILELEKKEGNRLFFRLPETKISDIVTKLSEFTVFSFSELTNPALFRMSGRYDVNGVFELNRMLLEMLYVNIKLSNFSMLVNNLIKTGISREKIIFLLLSGRNFEALLPGFLVFLKLFAVFSGRGSLRGFPKGIANPESAVESIIAAVSDMPDGEKSRTIAELLDYLMNNRHAEQCVAGELPFPDGEHENIRYIFNKSNNSVVFSFTLSEMGLIEILIKNDKGYNILISCANGDMEKLLKEKINLLKSGIQKETGRKINIYIYNHKVLEEKIIEINTQLEVNMQVDIRV